MYLFCHEYPLLFFLLFLLLGTCVGSFLNVIALRSLKEESIIWPSSYCPNCQHTLAVLDNIPVISFLILGGKCRYCQQSIHWQYPLVEIVTGLTYVAIAYVFVYQPIHLPAGIFDNNQDLFKLIHDGKIAYDGGSEVFRHSAPSLGTVPALEFQRYGLLLGCLVFASTLIAITITDLREKLIPHDITYPSMLFGIAFSALVRHDLLGAMAGIGASYIIFDFLAFYGLKVYMMSHGQEMLDEHLESQNEEQEQEQDQDIDQSFDIRPAESGEPIEVMGGGDAVLSAVMSAYLGWQSLVLSLVVGFIAGTVIGLTLLVLEMKKSGLLKECGLKSLKYGLISSLIFGAVMGLLTLWICSMTTQAEANLAGESTLNLAMRTALNTAMMGFLGGALIGMVKVGTRVSKPFPFGPALALGGFVSMFLIPYWSPFY